MLLIGWDVGIKNLSYCVIEYKDNNYTIRDWNIIDLRYENEDEEKQYILESLKKANKLEEKAKAKAKSKAKAKAKADAKAGAKTEDNDNDIDLNSKDNAKSKAKAKAKTKKCSKISLKDLSRNLYKKLEQNNNFSNFDYVIIENQPVLKNPTMKSIQMILYSYFSFKSLSLENFKDLILMSASNKLKVYKDEIDTEEMEKINKLKSKYSRNKKISILHTKLLLNEHEYNAKTWFDFFNNNKKKDDLADSFLMILYYLKKNKLIK